MKKIIVAVCLPLLLVVSSASVAYAQTATTTPSTVDQLIAQIKTLQAQIAALKAAQQKVNDTATDIKETFSLIKDLRQGMTGAEVSALQAALAADPSIYPEGKITGYYGALTVKAVKRFQAKHGIEQVGNVGPKTLKKLNELFKEHPIALENDDADGDDNKGKKKGEDKRPCAIVPPGHLIAKGWLKKHEGENKPVVPPCQTLPPGIAKKLGTTTPPTGTTTPPVDTTAPSITGVSTTAVSSTGGTILWATNEVSTSKVLYGTTSPVSVGATMAGNTTLVMSHSVALSGLSAQTTYYYIVVSVDAAGNTATSSQGQFTTLATPDTTAPAITSVSSANVSSTTATVSWTTNENATGKVYYGTTTPVTLGVSSLLSNTGAVTSHSFGLTGLSASTTYYYLAVSSDVAGNTATSSQSSFVTLP